MSATNQQLNEYKVHHYYSSQPFIFTRFLITLLKYNNKPSTCIKFQSKKESSPILSLFRFDMRIFLQKQNTIYEKLNCVVTILIGSTYFKKEYKLDKIRQ